MSEKKQGDLFSLPPASQARPVDRSPPAPVAATKTPAWRREPAVPVAAPPPSTQVAPPAAAEPKPTPTRTVLTVSQLTRQVKDTLEPKFQRVFVRGEVSNFRGVNARGHLYFALSDAKSSIDVKLWATAAAKLKFQLKDGLSVLIEGSVDVFEPQGRYSLIVDRIEPEGLGALALQYEQLKQKLVAEGLIGPGRKRPPRPLPFLPRRIGVVTSITGAALRDFLKVLYRRHPRLSVLVADARVQGDGAIFELRKALRWLSATDVDVIVVTRGGGSTDDLWTFNEEPVVRALWASKVPVVSAVGHEIDTTLADLVADVRAPTPSAAAEMIAPSLVDLEAQLKTLESRLRRAIEKIVLRDRSRLREWRSKLGDPRRALSTHRLTLSNAAERMTATLTRRARLSTARLAELKSRLVRSSPTALVAQRRQRLGIWRDRLRELTQARHRAQREALSGLRSRLTQHTPSSLLRRRRVEFTALTRSLDRASPAARLAVERRRLAGLRARLEAAARTVHLARVRQFRELEVKLNAFNPLDVLTRGFTMARTEEGTVIRRAAALRVGQQFELKFTDETVVVEVVRKKPSSV